MTDNLRNHWATALSELDGEGFKSLSWFVEGIHSNEQIKCFVHERIGSQSIDEVRLACKVVEEGRPASGEFLDAVLEALVAHPDDEATAWLLSALGAVGGFDTLALAVTFAGHRNPDVRDAAASTVSALGGEAQSVTALDTLFILTNDTDQEVRFSAMWELGDWTKRGCCDPRLRPMFVAGASDSDERIQRLASEALSVLARP